MQRASKQGGDVAVVRLAFARFEQGDLDGMFELVHPEAEFHPIFYPGSYRGRDQIRTVFEDAGARLRWDVSGLAFDQVGNHVLVDGRLHSTNTFGNVQELPIAWLLDVDDGMIVLMRGFVHRRQALDAIG